MVPEKAYCISCGEEVPVRLKSIGIEGEELIQCMHCHALLGTVKDGSVVGPAPRLRQVPLPDESVGEFRPDETQGGRAILPDLPRSMETPSQASGELGLYQPEPILPAEPEEARPPLETVMTVEDSTLISAILKDLLVAQGLTRRVISSKNGYEFLARYIRERDTGTPVGLIFMDVRMPVLNGISAAVAMRAHEKARELEPVPILFFTAKRCDETFRKVLIHCAPAMYINKGASESPEHLQDRISKVIRQLLKEEW